MICIPPQREHALWFRNDLKGQFIQVYDIFHISYFHFKWKLRCFTGLFFYIKWRIVYESWVVVDPKSAKRYYRIKLLLQLWQHQKYSFELLLLTIKMLISLSILNDFNSQCCISGGKDLKCFNTNSNTKKNIASAFLLTELP